LEVNFASLKIVLEMNKVLRYKLCMMGIAIDGPTNYYCDNQSVWKNATMPQSTLNKKHNSQAYHKCQEYVAMETVRIAFEAGKGNLSDCLTKFLAAPALKRFVQCILFRRKDSNGMEMPKASKNLPVAAGTPVGKMTKIR
jgi:hypothetical protein